MRRITLAAFVVAAAMTPVSAGASKYHGGCNTRACLERTCRSWECQRRTLPVEVKATLARLRGCETRGIRFPENYRIGPGHPRYNGHDGAYQYLKDTWHRAGGHGRAHQASPAEQDVRTARFFPSHRGEWACRV